MRFSQHPYIFFNQDHTTMTFIGFKVDDKGQCYDFKSNEPIKDCEVPVNVCECLITQGVDLQKQDCNTWEKYVCITIYLRNHMIYYIVALVITYVEIYFRS